MEKVVLNADQAKMIENHKGDFKTMMAKWHDRRTATYLDSLSADEIISAVFDGYEIEKPKFQPGDKIIRITDGKMFTLTNKSEKFKNGWFTEEFLVMIPEYEFRKPTPEETYWLETLERKNVFDFKVGDVVLEYGKDEHMITSDHESISATSYFAKKTNKLKGIYPAESFKPFPKESNS